MGYTQSKQPPALTNKALIAIKKVATKDAT